MLNGVNINYIIVLLVTGAVLLTAIYHTILYIHRRSALLAGYSAYLWSTFFYCGYRTIYFFNSGSDKLFFNPDEVLQMIAFMMYIRFVAIALELDPLLDRYAFLFTSFSSHVILGYLAINTWFINTPTINDTLYIIAKISIRVYLLFLGLYMLITVVLKRKSVFYRYLAAGAISMIACGLLSTLVNVLAPNLFIIGAISWLMFGFFLDVVFFSSAIGFRIRQEYNEREKSLEALLFKEAELQQKELEKLKAIYATREEERSRIAHDLHDEIGATLSGIALYSQLTKTQMQAQKINDVELSLDRMQESATDMVHKLSDIVWAVNPENDSLAELWQKLDDYAREMGGAKEIEVQVEVANNIPAIKFSMDVRRHIYLLLKEGINNAIKYSGCTVLQISFASSLEKLVFVVDDNGKGFDIDTIRRGNGLSTMANRAQEIEASLRLRSKVGTGTSLQLIYKIPQ